MPPDQLPEGAGLIADRRLLLTADRSHVVEESENDGAFLLAAVGITIPAAEVKRLGLRADEDGRVVQSTTEQAPDAAVKEQAKPDDKKRKKPADKAVKKPATKRRRKRAT